MRTLHGLLSVAAVIAGPLLHTGSSAAAPTTAATTAPAPAATSSAAPALIPTPAPAPTATTASRCYTFTTYDSYAGSAGSATAEELMRANLESAQVHHQIVLDHAAPNEQDPYSDAFTAQARGEVEGFAALLETARQTPLPELDAPLQALDGDGQLIAEVTFNTAIATERGTYALSEATLPTPCSRS
jgi:hypothetical protein